MTNLFDPRLVQVLNCPHCPYMTKRIGLYLTHAFQSHQKASSVRVYRCSICPVTSTNCALMDDHIKLEHSPSENAEVQDLFRILLIFKEYEVESASQTEEVYAAKPQYISSETQTDDLVQLVRPPGDAGNWNVPAEVMDDIRLKGNSRLQPLLPKGGNVNLASNRLLSQSDVSLTNVTKNTLHNATTGINTQRYSQLGTGTSFAMPKTVDPEPSTVPEGYIPLSSIIDCPASTATAHIDASGDNLHTSDILPFIFPNRQNVGTSPVYGIIPEIQGDMSVNKLMKQVEALQRDYSKVYVRSNVAEILRQAYSSAAFNTQTPLQFNFPTVHNSTPGGPQTISVAHSSGRRPKSKPDRLSSISEGNNTSHVLKHSTTCNVETVEVNNTDASGTGMHLSHSQHPNQQSVASEQRENMPLLTIVTDVECPDCCRSFKSVYALKMHHAAEHKTSEERLPMMQPPKSHFPSLSYSSLTPPLHSCSATAPSIQTGNVTGSAKLSTDGVTNSTNTLEMSCKMCENYYDVFKKSGNVPVHDFGLKETYNTAPSPIIASNAVIKSAKIKTATTKRKHLPIAYFRSSAKKMRMDRFLSLKPQFCLAIKSRGNFGFNRCYTCDTVHPAYSSFMQHMNDVHSAKPTTDAEVLLARLPENVLFVSPSVDTTADVCPICPTHCFTSCREFDRHAADVHQMNRDTLLRLRLSSGFSYSGQIEDAILLSAWKGFREQTSPGRSIPKWGE